jgi:hypothetical protein
MSEVYRYATQQVIDAGKQPTLDQVRRHFEGEGKEVLIIEVSAAEAKLMCNAGIGTYEHDGQMYAIATIPPVKAQRSSSKVL